MQRQASPNIVIALAGNKADLATKRAVDFQVSGNPDQLLPKQVREAAVCLSGGEGGYVQNALRESGNQGLMLLRTPGCHLK